MSTTNNPLRSLTELLAELEAAIRTGNRTRAAELARAIQQRLAADSVERAVIEARVRALLQQLDAPAAPAPSVTIVRGGDLERSAPIRVATADEKGVVCPVWFGTNRKPTADGKGFTGERHDRVTRGRADVFIPEAHRFGETGTSWLTKLKRFDFRDDRLRLRALAKLERAAFFDEVRQALVTARKEDGTAHGLFFLHGYNVTFEDAAIRAAQMDCDLKVPGATAFFSWPSKGNLEGYPADEASIEASERHITDFLTEFARECGADKIHVIAHSMGNRGLLRALQRIAADAQRRTSIKFGQIFLAAPDVDSDLFRDLAYLYPQFAERTTLYASRGDWPVWLSDKYHAAPRVGYFPPYTVAKEFVDTIAVPDFNLDLLGHSYFAQAEALLHDIYDLMRHGKAPAQRQRIAPAFDGEQTFWKLGR